MSKCKCPKCGGKGIEYCFVNKSDLISDTDADKILAKHKGLKEMEKLTLKLLDFIDKYKGQHFCLSFEAVIKPHKEMEVIYKVKKEEK